MTGIRYLLDENMPHAVRDQLLIRAPQIEVLVIGDEAAPALGTSDPAILHPTIYAITCSRGIMYQVSSWFVHNIHLDNSLQI